MKVTIDFNARDLRLYQYNNGSLTKVGNGKTGKRPHFFNTIEECENHANELAKYYKNNTQYVIIEYFNSYRSEIVNIIK